jgi:molecular chaperone GrpE
MEKDLELNEEVTNESEPELSSEKIIAELQDKFLRVMAENDNTRKRYEKQITDSKDYAIFNFAKDLIAVIDNCTRAIDYTEIKEDNENVKTVLQGIKLIHQELLAVLVKNGIESIAPNRGDKFDYNFHHAISKEEADEFDNDIIINVMQVGYKIKDRLLRPALVSVSTK